MSSRQSVQFKKQKQLWIQDIKKAEDLVRLKGLLQNQTKKKAILLYFQTEWCPPCHQLRNKLELEAVNKKGFILAFVDCDIPENAPLIKQFKITHVPKGFFLKKDLTPTTYQFIGEPAYHIAQIGAAIQQLKDIIETEGGTSKKDQYDALKRTCDKKHAVLYTTFLTGLYYGGYYICNICRGSGRASLEQPMLHCNHCNYDICNKCCQKFVKQNAEQKLKEVPKLK